jgi:hypothetical protein
MNTTDTTKVLELSSEAKPVTRRSNNKRTFASSDICDILKACYDSKVTRFSFDGLTVEFSGKDHPAKSLDQASDKQTPQSKNIEDKKDRLSLLGDKVDGALDQLEIEDPFAAELFAIDDQSIAERPTAPQEEES